MALFMDRVKNFWMLISYAGLLTAFVMSIVGLTGPYLPASEVCPSGSTLQTFTTNDLVDAKCAAEGGCSSAERKAEVTDMLDGTDFKANSVVASFCAQHDDEYTLKDLLKTLDDSPTALGGANYVKFFAENRAKSHAKEDETPTIEDMCSAATKTTPACASLIIPKDTVLVQDECEDCKTKKIDQVDYQFLSANADPMEFDDYDDWEGNTMGPICMAASKEFTCCLLENLDDTDTDKVSPVCKASSDAKAGECRSNTFDKTTRSIDCAYTVEKKTGVNLCLSEQEGDAFDDFSFPKGFGEEGKVITPDNLETIFEGLGLPSDTDVDYYVCADTQVRGLNCTEDAISGIDYCYEDIDGFDFMVSAVIVAIVFIVINFIAIMRSDGNDDKDMGVVISFFILSIIFIGIAFGYIYSQYVDTNPKMRQEAALGLTLTAIILTFFNLPLAALIRGATGNYMGSHMVLSNTRF